MIVAKRCLPLWIYGLLGRFDETSLSEKEDFYSHVNMEDIIDADYAHTKKFCEDFEIKNLGK